MGTQKSGRRDTVIAVTCPQDVKIAAPTVLILGDGRSLQADYERFKVFGIETDIYCIGRSVNFCPEPVDHWGNVDGAESIWWAENLPDKWRGPVQTHTLGKMRGFTHHWDIPQGDYGVEDAVWHGSTALFAALTCIAMGYRRVVLCGCPMDGNGHWYEMEGKLGPRWTGECYQAWLDLKDSEAGKRVRSMSGYTRIMMGEPTIEWLSSRPK